MSSTFATDTRTLGELLSGPDVLRVPEYQRSYAWTTREAGRLLEDLELSWDEARAQPSAQPGCFLGAVLLIETPATTGGARTFDIVDGQQRLVTLTILLCVLRDLAKDAGDPIDALAAPLIGTPDAPRLCMRDRDSAFLATYVQVPAACTIMPESVDLTPGEESILAVRELFAGELFNYEAGEIGDFARFLVAACEFAVVTTRAIDRAHRIFSVLNERGKPLARNDILKAQVLGALPVSARARLTGVWDGLELRLGARFEELFSHIRTLHGRGRGSVIAGIHAIVDEQGGAEAFMDRVLVPAADILGAIERLGSGHRLLTPGSQRYLRYLGWLGSGEWIPPLMLFWSRCGDDPARLEAFLHAYDRLVFAQRVLGVGADKRLSRLNAVMAALRNGADLDDAGNPLLLTREEQRNVLYNLRGLHTRSQLTCKLLLLRLNDELAGAPQNIDPGALTVEHVLPQKPARNSQWRAWFPLADEREACTQSLGNLVLVTREQNDRARNLDLDRKLAIYFPEHGPPALHLTRDLDGATEWRLPQIAAREERLVSAVRRMWQIEDARGTAMSAQELASGERKVRRLVSR